MRNFFLQSHQRESISPLGRRETFSSFGESWSEIWDKLIIIRKEKVLRTNEAYLFLIIEKMDYWRCFYGGSKASLSGSFMDIDI